MDNDKSTALVSVQDLSAVLQGVKKYIDSNQQENGGSISWDKLAGVQEAPADGLVFCNETFNPFEQFDGHDWGTKIPLNGAFDPADPKPIKIRNITFVRGYHNDLGQQIATAEELNEMLGGQTEFDAVYVGNMNPGYLYVVPVDELDGQPFFMVIAMPGSSDGCLMVFNQDDRLPELLMTCEVDVSGYDKVAQTPCPPEYVDSSLGNKNLKEDLLKASKVSWEKLYSPSTHCDQFGTVTTPSNHVFGGTLIEGHTLSEGETVTLKNVVCIKDISLFGMTIGKDMVNAALSLPADIVVTPRFFPDGSFDWMDEQNFLGVVGVGDKWVLNQMDIAINLAEYPDVYFTCDIEQKTQCPPSYVASSLGNASLEEDLKGMGGSDTFVAYNYLYLGKAHVEGNKLYLDNAEVEDNKLIIK